MSTISVVSPEKVGIGERFTVDIVVSPTEPVSGVQFDLLYNPTIVKAISVSQGNFLGDSSFFSPGVIDNSAGRVVAVYGVTIGKGSSVSTSGIFAPILFETVSTGQNNFKFDKVILGSPEGKALPLEVVEKDIEITGLFTLNSLAPVEKAHWELHLKVAEREIGSTSEITEFLTSKRSLPALEHPSYIHAWLR